MTGRQSSREWLTSILLDSDDIIDVSPLEEIFVDITTSKKRDKLTVAIVDDRIVRKKSVAAALSHKTRPEFILTIPRSVVWTGEAIEFVRSHQMGWGGGNRRVIPSD